jgi:hypothetical protein
MNDITWNKINILKKKREENDLGNIKRELRNYIIV